MAAENELVALYYPFSRCLTDTALKRAVLLYDHLLFIDPKSPKVRAGLYSVEHHQQYLPTDTAEALAKEWDEIADRYAVLEAAGLVSFIDPAPILARPTVDGSVTAQLQADMATDHVAQLFDSHPKTWSMLRSRIPKSAFPYLHYQWTPRALYPENVDRVLTRDEQGRGHSIFIDGRPDQDSFMSDPWGPEPGWKQDPSYLETQADYACVLPYYLGSSLSVSVALALASETLATPFTDSSEHHQLMSWRFQRAAQAAEGAIDQIPGLRPRLSAAALHRMRHIEMRLVDHVLADEDLDAITLEQCLEFRTATEAKRRQFRSYVRSIAARIHDEVWSQRIEEEIRAAIDQAQREIDAHAASLREDFYRLFRRAAIGVGVAGAPQLLNLVFPGIPAAVALILGGAGGGGLLADPIKDALEHFTERRQEPENGLTYLLAVRELRQA